MKRAYLLPLILPVIGHYVILGGILGCGDASGKDPVDTETDSSTNTDGDLEVLACYPVWKAGVYPASAVPFEKMTHLVLSFAIPRADGELDTSPITNLDQLLEGAREQGVQVLLSIGGAGGSAEFYEMALY